MERIDARRALELLTDIVDKAGDGYVYEKRDMTDIRGEMDYPEGSPVGCRYVEGENPSCLVGHVLVRAGVPVDRLQSLDVSGASASNLKDYGLDVTPEASRILVAAQRHQDRGETWGIALRTARGVYDRIIQETK